MGDRLNKLVDNAFINHFKLVPTLKVSPDQLRIPKVVKNNEMTDDEKLSFYNKLNKEQIQQWIKEGRGINELLYRNSITKPQDPAKKIASNKTAASIADSLSLLGQMFAAGSGLSAGKKTSHIQNELKRADELYEKYRNLTSTYETGLMNSKLKDFSYYNTLMTQDAQRIKAEKDAMKKNDYKQL